MQLPLQQTPANTYADAPATHLHRSAAYPAAHRIRLARRDTDARPPGLMAAIEAGCRGAALGHRLRRQPAYTAAYQCQAVSHTNRCARAADTRRDGMHTG